ncbi:MAG TPA: hypothetical protein VNM72_06415 [Blastocatellia bacterium]|nr:hypothetical protein [Blastocatellia bacterium]
MRHSVPARVDSKLLRSLSNMLKVANTFVKTRKLGSILIITQVAVSSFAQNATFEKVKFLGGTAEFKHKSRIEVVFDDQTKSIVLRQDERRTSFPYTSVTRITYGQNVRRRIKETVILGVTLIGVFAAPILLSKKREHQILIEYKDAEKAGAVLLEADKNRYRALLGTLRVKTGVEPTTEVEDSKK